MANDKNHNHINENNTMMNSEQKLDNNMKSLIAHILKNNNIISNISEFTNKSKEEIISFINDNKKILNDKKILIDISEDNK